MTDTTTDAPDFSAGIDPKAAAEWLAKNAPIKTTQQWAVWLQNNRASGRNNAWNIPFARVFSRVLYDFEDIKRLARVTNAASKRQSIDPEDAAWVKAIAKNPLP